MAIYIPALSETPSIIGSFLGSENISQQIKKSQSPYVQVLEIRADTFLPSSKSLDQSIENLKSLLVYLRRKVKKPLLLTCRWSNEQGNKKLKRPGSEQQRKKILIDLLPFCDGVDIELKSPLLKIVSSLARKKQKTLIHSFHDFQSIPSKNNLKKLILLSKYNKGDVCKIAVTPKTIDEASQFLFWGASIKIPTLLITMGNESKSLRYIAPSFGSRFCFGHLGKSAAPGQISVSEIGSFIKQAYRKN